MREIEDLLDAFWLSVFEVARPRFGLRNPKELLEFIAEGDSRISLNYRSERNRGLLYVASSRDSHDRVGRRALAGGQAADSALYRAYRGPVVNRSAMRYPS